MTSRPRAAGSCLLIAALLAGCAPRAYVLLPTPPEEVRKESAPAASPPSGVAGKAPLPDNVAKGPPPPDWGALYREAIRKTKEAIARGSGLEAVSLWKGLEESPFRVDAVFNRAVLLHRSGDFDAASAQYRRLAEAPPVFEPAAANLLGIHLLRGERDSARKLSDRLLPAGTSPPAGMIPELSSNIAAVLADGGEYGRATEIFLALRTRGQRTPAQPWNMAVLEYRRGDPEGARRLAAEAPPAVSALWPVAASRFAWERDPAKIPALDNVPRSEPRMAALSRNLAAYGEYVKGNRDAAERILSPSAGELGAFPQLAANRGIVQADAGKWAEARASFERATREAPGSPEPWLNLGLFREIFEGNGAAALECYENYVKLNGWRKDEVRKWVDWLQNPASP